MKGGKTARCWAGFEGFPYERSGGFKCKFRFKFKWGRDGGLRVLDGRDREWRGGGLPPQNFLPRSRGAAGAADFLRGVPWGEFAGGASVYRPDQWVVLCPHGHR